MLNVGDKRMHSTHFLLLGTLMCAGMEKNANTIVCGMGNNSQSCTGTSAWYTVINFAKENRFHLKSLTVVSQRSPRRESILRGSKVGGGGEGRLEVVLW